MNYIERLKQIEEDLASFEHFDGAKSIISKKKAEHKALTEELNSNTNWLGILGSFDDYLEDLALRQEEMHDKVDSIDLGEFFKSEIKRLFDSSKPILSRENQWEYCFEDILSSVIDCQNQKLKYLIECLKDNGVDTHGPESIEDRDINDFEFFTLSGKSKVSDAILEREKVSAKLTLTMLYRLGIIDHLRTFDSLKNNDRALSRVLHKILGIGRPDTFQTYLSAERSVKTGSSAPQNNPLSEKLIQEADEKLKSAGLKESETKKYYPK